MRLLGGIALRLQDTGVVRVRAAANHLAALEVKDEFCLGMTSTLHVPHERCVIVGYSAMLDPSALRRCVQNDVARPKIGRPWVADASEINDFDIPDAAAKRLVRMARAYDVRVTARE